MVYSCLSEASRKSLARWRRRRPSRTRPIEALPPTTSPDKGCPRPTSPTPSGRPQVRLAAFPTTTLTTNLPGPTLPPGPSSSTLRPPTAILLLHRPPLIVTCLPTTRLLRGLGVCVGPLRGWPSRLGFTQTKCINFTLTDINSIPYLERSQHPGKTGCRRQSRGLKRRQAAKNDQYCQNHCQNYRNN